MQRKINWLFIFVLLLSVLPLFDLFHAGLPVTHDGQDHVARIANFSSSLFEGHLIPRWAGKLNWGYGHPILMFLYPLPSYVASLIHFLGFPLVDSVKIVFAFSYSGSLLLMFSWAAAVWNPWVGVIAAILYGFAPYRFVDLYVRGALGEHMAFIFPPLAFYALFRLSRSELKRRKIWLCTAVLSIAGLILSHNALSLIFLPCIVLYGIYVYFFESKKSSIFLVQIIEVTVLGFGLAAFFWIPALLEGKYTLRDIVTGQEVLSRFVPWTWFISSPWNYGGGNQFSKEIGIMQWIGILLSLIGIFRLKGKAQWFSVATIILFFFSLFLMTSGSTTVWNSVRILQKFQFPWRMLSVSVFLSAIALLPVLSSFPKRFIRIIAITTFVLALLTTYRMWHAKSYKEFQEAFYTSIYPGTTDTGESSPIWSVRFMEHAPSSSLDFIEGTGLVHGISRTSTRHTYLLTTAKRARVVENTLYFPGWQVQVDASVVPVEFQDPNYRGLMTFWVEPGTHTVVVQFLDTRIRNIAQAISSISSIIIGITLLLPI